MEIDLPDELTRILREIADQQRITVEKLVNELINEYVRSANELASELEAWQEVGAEALNRVERLL
jgi:predicted DNA-binding ribbon-helix-helix protein